jgi:hypothetical protein
MVDTFDKLLWELKRCWMSTTRRQFTDEFSREAVGLLGSLAHIHSSMVTMSLKSSVLQPAKSVSHALTPDTLARHVALEA